MIACDIYMVATLALTFLSVLLLGGAAVAYLLEVRDDEPWVEPQPWRDEGWEMRQWD